MNGNNYTCVNIDFLAVVFANIFMNYYKFTQTGKHLLLDILKGTSVPINILPHKVCLHKMIGCNI